MSERIVIKEICEVYDGPHATPKKTVDGPVYLGIDAITDDGKINAKEFAHLSEEDYIKWTKRVTPQYGDIVFSYEATLGRYALIPKDFYGCLGRRLAIIRNVSKDIDTLWLYYYFLSPEWKQFIQSKIIKGSTVNRISVEDFPTYTVPNISIKVQRKIANILSKIDEKIALNNNINDNLAYQLKDIYNYWFNQFDFPHNDKHQYKADGGLMIWNDKIKRKIPAGWEIKSFGELCSLRNGINYDKSVEGDKMYRIINVRNISSSDLILNENDLDEISLPQKQGNKYCVSENSIIVARSGIPGATRILQKPSSNIIFCGFIICCTPCDDIYKYYLMFYLKQLEGSAATKTGGSILQNVSQDTLSNLPVPIPPQSLLREFNQIVSQSLELIHSNMQENTQLLKLRDWLLPMLMNGQATISD